MIQLGELALHVDAEILGNPELGITGATSIDHAGNTDITFVADGKHLACFASCPAKAAIISREVKNGLSGLADRSFLVVDDAESSFEKILARFRPARKQVRTGISSRANVSPTAIIAEDVDIHPGAFVGERVQIGSGSIIHANASIMDDTRIGSKTVIFPNAVIYENCVIGDRCLIHAGTVIGGYGFGYRTSSTHELAPQWGNVVLGNDVEVGCNSTIDRGTYDSTTIGDGTKIDNQVMIGHNCRIGRHNLLCAQVGIAGSSRTGDRVTMAGQVGIGDHLSIGDNVTLAAQSGVMHDLEGGQVYLGAPAIPARQQMQIHALIARLPEMRKEIRELKQTLTTVQGTGLNAKDAA